LLYEVAPHNAMKDERSAEHKSDKMTFSNFAVQSYFFVVCYGRNTALMFDIFYPFLLTAR